MISGAAAGRPAASGNQGHSASRLALALPSIRPPAGELFILHAADTQTAQRAAHLSGTTSWKRPLCCEQTEPRGRLRNQGRERSWCRAGRRPSRGQTHLSATRTTLGYEITSVHVGKAEGQQRNKQSASNFVFHNVQLKMRTWIISQVGAKVTIHNQ